VLGVDNLASWSFTGQNLTGASFTASTLTGASFGSATLDGADARGATGLSLTGAASTQNLILPDGSINGLNLSGGKTLWVRNYTASSIPLTVHTGMNMGTDGILQTVLDGSAWGSTISFDAGVPVTLGGALDVTFASGVNVGAQVGRMFTLFNWAGVTPTGTFGWQDDLAAGTYVWDTSHLYSAGTVTLLNWLPGDTNHDGAVNSLDIDAIYHNFGASATSQWKVDGDGNVVGQGDVTYELRTYFLSNYGDANLDRKTDFLDFQVLLDHWQASGSTIGWAQGDFNGDYAVDFLDFQKLLDYWNPGGWNFAPAQTPEPATLTLLALGGLVLLRRDGQNVARIRTGTISEGRLSCKMR
jgi:hypothetical protein